MRLVPPIGAAIATRTFFAAVLLPATFDCRCVENSAEREGGVDGNVLARDANAVEGPVVRDENALDGGQPDVKTCFWPSEIDGGLAPDGRYRIENSRKTWFTYPETISHDGTQEETWNIAYPVFLGDRVGIYRGHFEKPDGGSADADLVFRSEMLWIGRMTANIHGEYMRIGDTLCRLSSSGSRTCQVGWRPIYQTGDDFVVGTYLSQDPDGGVTVRLDRFFIDGGVSADAGFATFFSSVALGCNCNGQNCIAHQRDEYTSFGRNVEHYAKSIDYWPTARYVSTFDDDVYFLSGGWADLEEANGSRCYPYVTIAMVDPASTGTMSFVQAGIGIESTYFFETRSNSVQCGREICISATVYPNPPPQGVDFCRESYGKQPAVVRFLPIDGGYVYSKPPICTPSLGEILRNDIGYVVVTYNYYPGDFVSKDITLSFFNLESRYIGQDIVVTNPAPRELSGYDSYVDATATVVPDGDGWIVIYSKSTLDSPLPPEYFYPNETEIHGTGILRYRIVDTWADAGRDAGTMQ